MTPREWARLQGFDDSFVLPEGNSYMYKQLGNTVTVPVIEAIARKVRAVLTAYYDEYGVISRVVPDAILSELATGAKSRRELLDSVGYIFPTACGEEYKLSCLSAALQALKRSEKVFNTGKTRTSVWHLHCSQSDAFIDAELKRLETLAFAVKPALREDRLASVV